MQNEIFLSKSGFFLVTYLTVCSAGQLQIVLAALCSQIFVGLYCITVQGFFFCPSTQIKHLHIQEVLTAVILNP